MRAERPERGLFEELGGRSGSDLISAFIPTHEKGREVAQDPIQLKNQLSDVEDSLASLGYKPRERDDRLARARSLLDDREFWEHQRNGLAVFVDEDGSVVTVSSSKSLGPWFVVMPVFMLRPLVADFHPLPVLVLALTRDTAALFSATGSDVEAIDLDMPSYEDVNWFVDREVQRQQHPDRAGTDRNRHGHEPSSRADEDAVRYLRAVDARLKEFAADIPLVVLGDDDLVSRFTSVSERATVSPPSSGISAPLTVDEVRRMVEEPLEKLEEERVGVARSEAIDQLGEGQATAQIGQALPAAISGRVGSIVIERETPPIWGRLDLTTHEIETHEEHQPGDTDLLDRLVVWARDAGASVTPSETPIDGRPFIATFRY